MLDAGLAAPRRPRAGSAAGRRPAASPWAWPWWRAGSGCRARRPGIWLCGSVSCSGRWRRSSTGGAEGQGRISPLKSINGIATIYIHASERARRNRSRSIGCISGQPASDGRESFGTCVDHSGLRRRGGDHAWLLAGPALAQAGDGSWFPFKIPGLTTGSVTPAAPLPPAPATPGGPPEWSGESGASGHPLMTAEAIRAAAANFPTCLEGAVAGGGAARGAACRVRCPDRGAHARPADHGPARRAAGVHQGDLGLSGPAGERGSHPERPRHPGDPPCDLRRGREGLRGRPPRHHRDLGRRIQLRHPGRRAPGGPLDRDARLHRPPAGLFPRGIPVRARDPRPWRRHRRASAGLLGRRLRADPVHAHELQEIRGRFRRRRPPRRGRFDPGPDRLDRQQPEEGRLDDRPDLGLRGRGAGALQLHAGRSRAGS